MNLKSLTLLIAAAVAATVAAVWINGDRATAPRPEKRMLAPNLADNVNAITAIKITKAGDQTVAELKRGESGWVAANKYDYPADLDKIRETILALANAKIIEEKTSNPEYYERLGVQDPSDPKAKGMRVDIEGMKEPFRLIIGSYASGSADGTYVRQVGEKTSWLVSGKLSLDQTPEEWLDRSILDIPPGRIQSISLHHPDGETLKITKASRDQAHFTLAEIPQGRELSYETVADTLGGTLAGLSLEDVQPAAAVDPGEQKVVEGKFRTFDGLVITSQAFEANNRHYVRFQVDFDADQSQRFAPKPDPESEKTAKPAKSDEQIAATAQAEAERLNSRLSPWTYVIAGYKYDNMTKRMENLLKAPEKTPAEQKPTED